MPTEIQLARLTKGEVRTLSGQERGVEARALFELDTLDEVDEPIIVRVPTDLEAVTPSFVQGMFSKSIKRFKSREEFLSHYRFVAGPTLLRQIDDGIRNSLMRRDNLLA
jgi:hypothetical protein